MKGKAVQEITTLFMKSAPVQSHQVTSRVLQQAKLETQDEKHLEPILNYISCLKVHKQYLQFFEIGVVRDQRKKIEQVAKYVGLALDSQRPIKQVLGVYVAEDKKESDKVL